MCSVLLSAGELKLLNEILDISRAGCYGKLPNNCGCDPLYKYFTSCILSGCAEQKEWKLKIFIIYQETLGFVLYRQVTV